MDCVKIVPYAPKYAPQAKELLLELQAHLVACDPEAVQVLKERYREEYLGYVLGLTERFGGAVFLALRGDRAVGFAAGYPEPKDEEDLLTNRCPKRGVLSELVVSAPERRQSTGRQLLCAMEEFFRAQGCEFIAVDVFAPNRDARGFYEALGYAPRNIEYYKRIGEKPEPAEEAADAPE